MDTSNGWFTPSNASDQTTVMPVIQDKPKGRKRTPKRISVVPVATALVWIGLAAYIVWRLFG